MKWNGLEEFRRELTRLPDDLKTEASRIVEESVNRMAMDVRQQYHRGPTGNLIGNVFVTHFNKGRFSAGAIVKNTAKHAWLYDHGSQARHYFTRRGKEHPTGRMWGRSRPRHVFVRTAQRYRGQMFVRLIDMVRRHGLKVTG